DSGFAPSNVLSLQLTTFGTASGEKSRRAAFFQQLWERVRRLPGVEAAGGVSALPLTGGIGWGTVTIEGYNAATGQSQIQADFRVATVGYFETMKIPLIGGRFFAELETNDSEKVVIVDQNMARAYWPNTNPVGKRLKFGSANSDNPW